MMRVLIFFFVIFCCKLNAQNIDQIISFINKDRSVFEDYVGIKYDTVEDDEIGKDYIYVVPVGNKRKVVHVITSFNIIKQIGWLEFDNYFDLFAFNTTYLAELKKYKFRASKIIFEPTFWESIYNRSIREFIEDIKKSGNPSYAYFTYLIKDDIVVLNSLSNESYLIMVYDRTIVKKELPKLNLKEFRDNIIKPRAEN